MAKRLDFSKIENTCVNDLIFIAETDPHITIGGNKHRMALCRCVCGVEKKMQISSILNNAIKSCGCHSRKIAAKRCYNRNLSHGMTNTPEYNAWVSMKKRCFNKNHKAYKDYGLRGITVCDEWVKSFEAFIGDMGFKKQKTDSLDRIDNNGSYCKDNCRWATKKEQGRNQRSNQIIYYKGISNCLSEWASILDISHSALYYRLFTAKWSIEKSFETPINKK